MHARSGTDGASAAAAACVCLSAVVVAPPLEEAFFRGFLLPTLTRWLPPAAAVAASSAVFAAVHFAPALGTAQTFAVGAVLGAVLLSARGNLAAPMLAHAGYNALSLAAFAAAASPAGG